MNTKLVRKITITWCLEDVQDKAQEMGYELTDEQASDILQIAKKYHDCNYGLSWDTFWSYINDYVREHKIPKTIFDEEDEDND